MMIVSRLCIYLICFSLVGCSKPNPVEKKSEKVVLAEKACKECAQILSARHGLKQCGEGGAMMYEIKDLFLAFYIYHPLTKEEARAILIDCAHEVITRVNNNPEIQKYLLPGGFTKESVQIQIYIKPNHQKNYFPDLGVCSYNFGDLAYDTYDPDNSYRYKSSERETYQEAIALLKAPHKSEPFANAPEETFKNIF